MYRLCRMWVQRDKQQPNSLHQRPDPAAQHAARQQPAAAQLRPACRSHRQQPGHAHQQLPARRTGRRPAHLLQEVASQVRAAN